MSEDIVLGCLVRAEWKGHRDVIGTVVGTAFNDTAWVLRTTKGETVFLKCYCKRIQSNEAGVKARRIKQGERLKRDNQVRDTLTLTGLLRHYGDGELE
jgi:hypothetical protein